MIGSTPPLLAALLAVPMLAGCGSCGNGASRADGVAEDSGPMIILSEPDGKAFRLNKPFVPLIFDGGTRAHPQPNP